MTEGVEAIYSNGVLKPTCELSLQAFASSSPLSASLQGFR